MVHVFIFVWVSSFLFGGIFIYNFVVGFHFWPLIHVGLCGCILVFCFWSPQTSPVGCHFWLGFIFIPWVLAISLRINFVRIVPMVRIFCLCRDFCLAFLEPFVLPFVGTCFVCILETYCYSFLSSGDWIKWFLLFSRHICIQVSFETCRLIGFPLDYDLLTIVERLFVCPFKEFFACPFGSCSVLTMIFWPLSSDLFSLHYDSRDFYFALWRRFCFAFLGLCSVLTMIFWPYLETFVSPLSRSF